MFRFQGSVFVSAFHLQEKVDENRACSISIRFFKVTDPCAERSFYCVNTIRFSEPTKIGSCQ